MYLLHNVFIMKNLLFFLALIVSFTSLAGSFDVNVSTNNEDMKSVIIVEDSTDLQKLDLLTLHQVQEILINEVGTHTKTIVIDSKISNSYPTLVDILEPDLYKQRTTFYTKPFVDKLYKATSFRSWCIS